MTGNNTVKRSLVYFDTLGDIDQVVSLLCFLQERVE